MSGNSRATHIELFAQTGFIDSLEGYVDEFRSSPNPGFRDIEFYCDGAVDRRAFFRYLQDRNERLRIPGTTEESFQLMDFTGYIGSDVGTLVVDDFHSEFPICFLDSYGAFCEGIMVHAFDIVSAMQKGLEGQA